jgi:cyclic dehypoxanthinyl futalosine synthase
MSLDHAVSVAEEGGRVSFHEARELYERADLLDLGRLAQIARSRLNPLPVVTYAIDRNINYTNICVSGCRFCAFWRKGDDKDAYVLDDETLMDKLRETKALGGTHILFQGGLNPDLDLEWHEERIKLIRSTGLNLHGYSPPEIHFLAQRYGKNPTNVLERFIKAGLSSMPGGGGEILCDRVRRIVSPGKADSRAWLSVTAAAHSLGLKTTATMMFGHIETTHERLLHLFRLRRLQDQTGGFTSFIPWTYQACGKTLPAQRTGSPGYLRMLSVARLVLDNFRHMQASWVTQGPEIAQTALYFGADDLGSTMIEENVVAAAGAHRRLRLDEMVRLIAGAGFKSAQRDNVHSLVTDCP